MPGHQDFNRHATAAFIAPFLAFVGVMALERMLQLPAQWLYPLRLLVAGALIGTVSWPYFSLRVKVPVGSLVVGAAVFLIWIAPDVLFGYRHHWLFENAVTGSASSSLDSDLIHKPWFIVLRFSGAALLVPVLEELFWRGWMMRWLIDNNFMKVPLGMYTAASFWIVAALFASEHGPYWEVGLAAGIVYNWWMIRTKSLGDCILAHAITNAILSGYVLLTDQWQYWL
jgi:CAAX prenyl protease-like protein